MTTKELYKAARAVLGGRVGLKTSVGESVDPLDPKIRDADWGRYRVVAELGVPPGESPADRAVWLERAVAGAGLAVAACDATPTLVWVELGGKP